MDGQRRGRFDFDDEGALDRQLTDPCQVLYWMDFMPFLAAAGPIRSQSLTEEILHTGSSSKWRRRSEEHSIKQCRVCREGVS